MKAKFIMTAGATVYAICGLALLFFSKETLGLNEAASPSRAIFITQLFGAAMLGLAAMNWIARSSILGGIYGRAILVGNFYFAFISLLINSRALLNAAAPGWLGISTAISFLLTSGFGYLLFGKAR